MERWGVRQYGFRLYRLEEIEPLLNKAGFGMLDVMSVNDPSQGLFYCVNAQVLT
jgi:hypothetical protein